MPRVIAITGVMAAGKSTVAQLLAERLDRSVHVRGDLYRRMIVRGGAPIVPEGSGAMDAELRLRYRLAAITADTYAEAGFTAVVQDIITGSYLAEFVALVRSRPMAVVVLAPEPSAVSAREAARPKSGYKDGWTVEGLDANMRAYTPRLGLWLDTTDQSPGQTVEEILAWLPDALVDETYGPGA